MDGNLKVLTNYAEKYGIKIQPQNKVVLVPIYCFIAKLLKNLQRFISTNASNTECWGEFIVLSEDVKRQNTLSNLIGSWVKYRNQSLQCQLLSTFLTQNNLEKLKFFLKIRKVITVCASNQQIDQISLKHEDIIGILHKTIKSESIRKNISNGLKRLLISYKINQPKIYSCVFIEFVLSFFHLFDTQYGQARITQTMINNSNSIPIQNTTEINFHSGIHQENGLYRKNKNNLEISILQRKFLSPKKQNFTEEKLMMSRSMSRSSNILNNPSNKSLHRPKQQSYAETIKKQLQSLRKSKAVSQKEQFKLNFSKYDGNNESSYQQPNSIKQSIIVEENSKDYNKKHKFIKILDEEEEEEDDEEQIIPNRNNKKQLIIQQPYGYSTWQKMIQSNKQFKERMLKPNIENNDQIYQTNKISNTPEEPITIRDTLLKKNIYWE